MRASRLAASRPDPGLLVSLLVAAVTFWVAYDNGSYGLESRGMLAIGVWWALIVVVVFGLLPSAPVARSTLLIGGLLLGFAVWTLASVLWSPSAEKTFDEFNRVTLYLGVFALVTLTSSRRMIGRWVDGLTMAISAVAVVAFASRLVPGLFPEGAVPTFLPTFAARLSFPLGYWNALAILVALGVPLLLRAAVLARSSTMRGLAVALLPLCAAVIYLASSRGGVLTAIVGTIAFAALSDRRWTTASALASGALGSAAAIAVLLERRELVNGPLGTDLVERQAREAGLLIALACALVGATYAIGHRLLHERIRLGRATGWTVVAVIVGATAIGIIASDPVERFETFRTPLGTTEGIEREDFARAHLLSGGGGGRWQVWTAAIDEWREDPIVGDGAGAYESWWAEHGSIALFVKDAHSLYVETLGELGVVGFLLLVGLVVVGLGVGIRRSRGGAGELRITIAALTAVFAGYAAAAAFDWVWEVAVLGVVAFAALALVSGSAAAPSEPLGVVDDDRPPPRLWRRGFGIGIVGLLVAWALVFAQAIPLLAQNEINESETALGREDLDGAFASARAARDIQPWAATPYLQLALVSEEAGLVLQARQWISEAIERDSRDWRLWLVSARLETKLGQVAAAEQSLQRAVALNPRSPLFRSVLGDAGG